MGSILDESTFRGVEVKVYTGSGQFTSVRRTMTVPTLSKSSWRSATDFTCRFTRDARSCTYTFLFNPFCTPRSQRNFNSRSNVGSRPVIPLARISCLKFKRVCLSRYCHVPDNFCVPSTINLLVVGYLLYLVCLIWRVSPDIHWIVHLCSRENIFILVHVKLICTYYPAIAYILNVHECRFRSVSHFGRTLRCFCDRHVWI